MHLNEAANISRCQTVSRNVQHVISVTKLLNYVIIVDAAGLIRSLKQTSNLNPFVFVFLYHV